MSRPNSGYDEKAVEARAEAWAEADTKQIMIQNWFEYHPDTGNYYIDFRRLRHLIKRYLLKAHLGTSRARAENAKSLGR